MTAAARLLCVTPACRCARSAERTGYAAEFAFAKAFRREVGTAPDVVGAGPTASGKRAERRR
ncbi:hypothetical protein ACBJ59_20950 [Nonomuraea sp. MTCD27]|uniref:hypothetical protein n=1 Tax=Nonomuraea sp. MTCD27 TaxID=1676747 RepID=UPI0035C15553